MAAANPHISDDFNYEIWAPITKDTLIANGLWDVVENGVSPDPSKIPELASKIQPEELSKWRDLAVKDMKALQILQSSLTDSVFRKTLSASSAKDVWDLLQEGNEERRLLEKEFEEVKRNEKESFDSFLDRVLGITEQLRVLKIAKSDYEICKKLFASLSESYDGVHSILKELMTVHNMSAISLVNFFMLNGYDFESVTEEVLLGLLKAVRLQSEAEKLYGECYMNNRNCNMVNQIDEEEEAEEEIVAEYLLSTPVTLGEKTYDDDIWMVYAAATNHMTPYEKYFTTLDRTFKAKVGLVDGTRLMVEGRGAVKIRMKEGKKKTIENVIFVPGLNRNVLSFRQMLSRGYSFTEGRRGECVIRDRTECEFGETLWVTDEKGLALRLQVIEGSLTS